MKKKEVDEQLFVVRIKRKSIGMTSSIAYDQRCEDRSGAALARSARCC